MWVVIDLHHAGGQAWPNWPGRACQHAAPPAPSAAMSDPLEDASHLSRRTTPTWEVELLISGVAVFAMLQLPGWLDDQMFALAPRLGDEWLPVLKLSYYYAKSAAVVLAATFALHLLLRAQWIALVGMHSVYPLGIRLDRLKMGPIQRAIEEAQPGSTADAIERADNHASVAFALGVSVALVIVSVCIGFCGTLLAVTLLVQMLGWPLDPLLMMYAIFGLFMAPYIAAVLLDHALAARLRHGSLAHRVIDAMLRFYARIGMGRRNNRIIAILTSNGGERRMMAVVMGVMLAAIIGVITADVLMRGATGPGNYSQFPDADTLAIDPAHYDDQRDPNRDAPLPFVQSTVVPGPYLRLVVPYRPNLDEAAMRATCTGRTHGLGGAAQAAARLACLQSLHGAMLDGKPLAALRYDIASDPRTGRPALLAMIDVRQLDPGRHELRIARPVRAARKPDKDHPDPGYDAIPFWR